VAACRATIDSCCQRECSSETPAVGFPLLRLEARDGGHGFRSIVSGASVLHGTAPGNEDFDVYLFGAHPNRPIVTALM
jgi:hypothetical protein